MSGEMLDTTPEAKRFYFERLARMTSAERLALMDQSSRMIRHLAEASIRKEYPGVPDDELRIRLAVRLYGRETVEEVFGSLPEDAR